MPSIRSPLSLLASKVDMIKSNYFLTSFGIAIFLFCCSASATTFTVYGLTIKIYAAGTSSGATANMIQSNKGLYNGGPHPWCGNRAYIDTADKELYAAALAAALTQSQVSIIYDDAGPARTIPGHNANFICKVISIFQQ